MNNGVFAGRLGQDPKLNTTNSGTEVCNFTLAVDRYKKDDGPLWLDVSVWGKSALSCHQYLRKGSQAVVSGEVDLRTYPKQDGTQGASVTVNAHRVTFIGGKADGQDTPRADVPVDVSDFAPAGAAAGAQTDDIPFLCEPLPEWVSVKGTERS